jgi:hypothetical protein
MSQKKIIARIQYPVHKDKKAIDLFRELHSLFPEGGYTPSLRMNKDNYSETDAAIILVYDEKVLNYYKFFLPDINIVEY